MVSFRLEFIIGDKSIDTFLLGSRQYFEVVGKIISQFTESLDINVEFKYKLVEVEKNKITYLADFIIDYPIQGLLWGGFNKKQIDNWVLISIDIAFTKFNEQNVVEYIQKKAEELKLNNNFIYMEIIEENIKKNLEELNKLSILLFKNLYYFEDKDRKSE